MILVVCTGNTCRSPMAEAMIRHHLADAGLDMAVASAGTLGWNGAPATPHVVEVLGEFGIDLGAHKARRVTKHDLRQATLIIPMTRIHAWSIAAKDPEAASRTFLLDELVRLGRAVGDRGRQPLENWLVDLDAKRPSDRLARASEEVLDPAGEPVDVYRATAVRLDRSVRRLVALL